MSRTGQRRASLWPWLLWALAVMLAVAALLLSPQNRGRLDPREINFALATVLTYGVPGALILSRHRGNNIGWLFLGVALAFAAQQLALHYAVYALRVQRQPLPGAEFAAWLQHWTGGSTFVLAGLLLLLYPNGRLPSRRWWPLPLLMAIGWGGLLLMDIVSPGARVHHGIWDEAQLWLLPYNPTYVPALYAPLQRLNEWGSFWALSMLTMLACALTPLLRFRRADYVTRQQLRWLVFVIGGVLLGLLLAAVAGDVFPFSLLLGDEFLLFVGLILGIPLAVSVAILRYRLYDIDLIIRRTLVYSLLTALLALIYFSSIILLQRLFSGLTGEQSPFAIVISTLAMAALFAPVRRRVQDVIDRRFYRKKYDAEKALAAFAATVRDETDLDRLTASLVATVQETVQPESVTLWLARSDRR